jgi:hypothetical protein
MLADVLFAFDMLIVEELFDVPEAGGETGDATDHIADEVKAVEIVVNHHVEPRVGRAFLFLGFAFMV